MKNIINEKPTYTELENKLTRLKKDENFLAIITLVLLFGILISIAFCVSTMAKYHNLKAIVEYEKFASKAKVTEPIDFIYEIKLKQRENDLQVGEIELRMKMMKFDAKMQVESAKLDIQKQALESQLEALAKIVKKSSQ